MRKILLYMVLSVVILASLVQTDQSREILKKYLIEQQQYVHKGVEEKFVDENFYIPNRIDYISAISKSLTNRTDIFAFNVNDTSYLILNNELYKISPTNITLEPELYSSFPSGRIISCKTIDYLNFTTVALTYANGITFIYWFKHSGDGYTFIQSIYSENPRDSLFFVNDGKLYLAMVKELGRDISMFLTYVWTGTHFDQSQRLITRKTTSLSSFRSEETEILILVQTFKNASFALVLEFRNDTVRKVQHLQIDQPEIILPYKIQNDNYIVNLGENKHSLYWWSGSELLEWSTYKSGQRTYNGILIPVGNASLILSIEKKILATYFITRDGFTLLNRKIHDLDLENISKITTFLLGEHLLVVAKQKEDIKIELVKFRVYTTKRPQRQHEQRNRLLECLLHLENRTNILRHTVLESKRVSRDTSLFTDIDDSSEFDLISTVRNELEVLSLKINTVDEMKDQYMNVVTKLIIYGDENQINGNVKANTFHGKVISMRKLQNKKWAPEQWLRNAKPQSIDGPVKIKTIKTKYLESNLKVFEDLMINTGRQVIDHDIGLNKLSVQSLQVENINNIALKDVYVKSKGGLIKGVKLFENLASAKAFVYNVNGEKYKHRVSPFFSIFNKNLRIVNLQVKNIDKIDWEGFKNSAFRIGKHHEINGNLFMKKTVAQHLKSTSLNHINTDLFLNTKTNQTVEGVFEVNQVIAENVTTGSVNDIVLEKQALVFGENTQNILEGPIHMMETVTKNLIIRGSIGDDVFENVSDFDKKSLLQMYHGKVKIKGTVHIANLKLAKDANISLSGHNVTNNILNEYWTKSTTQPINVLFEASEGMVVPDLRLTELNSIPIEKYMINDKRPKDPSKYYFENVKISGNVYLNQNDKHYPDLLTISKESVKLNGTYEIKGKKTYTSPLKVSNLNILEVPEFVQLYIKTELSGPTNLDLNNITKLVVKGSFECDTIKVNKTLNKVSLEDLKKKALYVDVGHKFQELHFANATVERLTVSQWNNRSIRNFIMNGLPPFLIEDVDVNGDVVMSEVVNLRTINGHHTEALLKHELDIMAGQLTIPKLVFQNKTTVTDLVAAIINDIYLPSLVEKILYHNLDQTIMGSMKFKRIEADNIIVDYINDISTQSMVDINTNKNQIMNVTNELVFRSYVTIKSFYSNDYIGKRHRGYSQESVWPFLVVKGNVTFMDEMSVFQELFKNAVTSDQSVDIHTKVTLADVETTNVYTNGLVNNINVTFLIQDALYKYNKEEQVINGHIIFEGLTTSEMLVHKNLDTFFISNVNIHELDKAIIRNHSQIGTITGQKTFFSGLQCKYFNATSIQEELNHVVDKFNLKVVPEIVFDAVVVDGDLNIKQINNKNLNFLLGNRMLLRGPEQVLDGRVEVDSMKVRGNVYTESINDVAIENVVFDYDSQKIQNRKTFMNDVIINGSIKVEYLNGELLSEQYKRAIIKNENPIIQGNIIMSKPAQVKGHIHTKQINGLHVTDLMSNLKKGAKYMGPKTEYMIKEMQDVANKSTLMMIALQNEYMYMEKAQDIQLSIPNALNAEAVSLRGFQLIHITKDEAGPYCGLPSKCTCKVQETVQITPHNSVVSFSNKDYRRVYSYDDETTTYHFVTNSTSYSDSCRSEKHLGATESAMLTWNTRPSLDKRPSFYMYPYYFPGYISVVKYFTINGHTYLVIGRYYDALHKSYDLDCIVLEMSATKDSAKEIQRIRTRGVRTLTLFHSANGLILVVGNVIKSNEDDYTQIFKFDVIANKFKMLRIVPGFGCSAAEGVVFGTESMIILAHEKLPLQILKYEEAFDNYYFYQSLDLESNVASISVFYIKDYGISDAFLCAVTENNRFYIYSYHFVEGWIQISSAEYDGLKSLSVFTINKNQHLFVGSSEMSWLLRIVKYGSD